MAREVAAGRFLMLLFVSDLLFVTDTGSVGMMLTNMYLSDWLVGLLCFPIEKQL